MIGFSHFLSSFIILKLQLSFVLMSDSCYVRRKLFLTIVLIFLLTLLSKPFTILWPLFIKAPGGLLDLMVKVIKFHKTFTSYTGMDFLGDAAAILNSLVSNSYYAMLRGQIHTNFTPKHPYLKQQNSKWPPYRRKGSLPSSKLPFHNQVVQNLQQVLVFLS